MNKLLIALIAGTFAATVGAQTLETPKDKSKQATVESVTKSTTDTATRQSQEKAGVAEAKAIEGYAEGAAYDRRQEEGRRRLDQGKHDDRRDHVARAGRCCRGEGLEEHAEGAADQAGQAKGRRLVDQGEREPITRRSRHFVRKGRGRKSPAFSFCGCDRLNRMS